MSWDPARCRSSRAGFPLDALRQVYEVNVIAPLGLVQSALPQLKRSGGIVVSVSSDAAVEAYEGWGGYGSSKSALDQAAPVLAVEESRSADLPVRSRGTCAPGMHQAATSRARTSRTGPNPESAMVPALRRLLESGKPAERSVSLATHWGQ